MTYSKPLITIELDEYNELKKNKNESHSVTANGLTDDDYLFIIKILMESTYHKTPLNQAFIKIKHEIGVTTISENGSMFVFKKDTR